MPAYQKYKKLGEVDITDFNNDECNKLEDSDDGDKRLCNQVMKNLSILKDKQGKEQKDGCFYFQNWLHDQIKGKYYNGKVQSSKYSIANRLFDFVAEDILLNGISEACKGNSFGNPETWKKEKDLHDYFENFENIKCKDSDRDECEKYVKYVTYIQPMYEGKTDEWCYEGELDPLCNLPIKCDDKYDTKGLVAELKKTSTSLDIPSRDSHEQAFNAATTYNSGISSDAGHESLAVVPSTLERVSDKVDSNFIRNIIMAVAVLGTIFYLFYNSRSSRLEPSSRKRKQKKLFEHNYYEEYEKEAGMYDSEETFLDSEMDRLYLNYHPDQDYNY
ncbi:CYIR protein [Plasmodium cynomolgi strain B]|uniref:CYIR protein n=1 Tax=Plasmodium cynomolgi (strain B) TaxID=1120755 RepID=K6UF88_PLACD|nr:CYIR protein [Plasmodium cynomolgi strain B]GAB69676.1 CYIR protein [Plasmodium cynomolgi strain B]